MARQKKPSQGWQVILDTLGKGRVVATGLTEAEARAEARRRNEELNAREGVPVRSPFPFYYAVGW